MRFQAKQWARGLLATIEEQGVEHLDEIMEAFVLELQATHRRSAWREIVRELDRVWKERFGAGTITIVSASSPSSALLATITERFSGASLRVQTDPEVIGGTSIRIDDRMIDGTLRTKLSALKHQLTQ